MNELYIVLESKSWIYFKTKQKDCSSAYSEFLKTLEDAGINVDNVKDRPTYLEVRDSEENVIDKKNM